MIVSAGRVVTSDPTAGDMVAELIGDDTLWGVDHLGKGAANTPAALKSIRAARTDGAPICVILDNLSVRKGADIRRWAWNRKGELCFTPACASWANPMEPTADR